MKYRFLMLICWGVLMALQSCDRQTSSSSQSLQDTTEMVLTTIRDCSRLYTVEYDIHKIVLHEDTLRLNGKIMQHDFSVDVPQSARHIAIPMDATLKAYIDMSRISKEQILRKDSQIVVMLPTPQVVLTSSRINHSEIKQYVGLLGRSFSDAELAQYEKQGREAVLHDLPQQQIKADAMRSAENMLVPMLQRLGYAQQNIKVVYRNPNERVSADNQVMDNTTIERHE